MLRIVDLLGIEKNVVEYTTYFVPRFVHESN